MSEKSLKKVQKTSRDFLDVWKKSKKPLKVFRELGYNSGFEAESPTEC